MILLSLAQLEHLPQSAEEQRNIAESYCSRLSRWAGALSLLAALSVAGYWLAA